MTTSDGISDFDWSTVRGFAEAIVEANSNETNSDLLVASLVKELRRLEVIYGRLPSILATEADFMDDRDIELSLLKEAYLSACELGDIKNQTFVSASLAEYYVEKTNDRTKALYWLNELKSHMPMYSESYIDEVCMNLERALAVES